MDSHLPKAIGQPAQRAFAGVGIENLRDFARFSEAELLALHGVGPRAIRIIRAALDEYGVNFANHNGTTVDDSSRESK